MLRCKLLSITLLAPSCCVLLALTEARAGAISGVCPDGSIFIVQRAEAIPCRDAKTVDPGDVPPLNPEFLPRPYGWDVFNRETDPNNPYNLVDDAARPPVAGSPPAPGGVPRVGTQPSGATAGTARGAGATPAPTGGAPPTPAVGAAPQAASSGPALALTRSEIEDLAAIIEVLQDRAPATLVPRDEAGAGLALRFARSAAFEARVHRALATRGAARGPVVAFEVVADAPAAFWGHLTFVQGHVAHLPDPTNPDQFGLVEGRLGALGPGDRVLGYAVLPEGTDLREPIDVYWDDRRLTATLAPTHP